MFNTIKRALFVGAVALGGLLPAAVPAAHAATPPQFVVSMPSSVPVGGAFDMTVALNTYGTPVTAWQFGFTYDPAVLTIATTSATTPPNVGTISNYVSNAATTLGASAGNVAFKLTADGLTTSPGNVQKGGQALSGQAAGTGFTDDGTGVLVTFHFTGNAGANAITALNFNNLKVTDVNAVAIAGVTVSPATPSITVGTPPAPKLAIKNQTTAAVTGAPTQFNVSFLVDNTAGTAASTAGTATVSVTNAGATPASASVAVPAINAGASSATLSAGPFTLASGQTLAQLSIALPGASSVTTAYSYSAYASQGSTNIDATTAGVLKLTPPSDLTGLALVPNKTNTATSTTPMNVQSNLTSFTVTVSGTNNGFLAEYDGTAYVPAGKKLNNPLQVSSVATPVSGNTVPAAPQSITGTPSNYVAGVLAGQDAANGATFATTFSQFVGFNDPSVVAPRSYHETVTFAAAGAF